MNFVLYAVALFGFCYIVGLSKISHAARNAASRIMFVERALCTACLSENTTIKPQRELVHATRECRDCGTHADVDAWYPFRWPLQMVECPACLSTWVGLFVGILFPSAACEIAGPHFSRWFIFTLLSAGSSAIIGLFTGVME